MQITTPFVLLTDTEPTRRARTRDLLEGFRGCRVSGEASSGEEALRLCGSLGPDLVILEASLCLSGESPIELCRDIKSLTPAPIIVLYGNDPQGGSADLHRAFSGAEAFVDTRRPDAFNRLTEAVSQALSGAKVCYES